MTIVETIGEAAALEQLAEEATELAHAALKLARAMRKENPTPVKKEEAALNLIIAGILLWYVNAHPARRKHSLAVYLVLYAPVRFVLEYFRNDYRGSLGPFSTSQCISIGMFLAGAAVLARARRGGSR